MCNLLGFDFCTDGSRAWIDRHSCGVIGDCGHPDNPVEDAAEQAAQWHEQKAASFRSGNNPIVIDLKRG